MHTSKPPEPAEPVPRPPWGHRWKPDPDGVSPELAAARERGRPLLIALGEHDPTTLAHSYRVRRFALWAGRELGLDAEAIGRLAVAAEFHDVGKLAIPAAVLCKPARLTPDEYRLVQTHAARGADLVRDLTACPVVHAVVRGHHERHDGRGYPDGLRGDEIPLLARVLAVADAFEAMTGARPYHQPLPWPAASDVLLQEAGSQFHPEAAEAFVAALHRRAAFA